jgi:hypothetical protein
MSAVEIRLSPGQLPREMGAMRVWLDRYRYEASRFSCRDEDGGVLLCVEFKRASEAQAFARQFGGRSTLTEAGELPSQRPETGFPPSELVG